MRYVLALDVGTSSVRASLYDEHGGADPEVVVAREHSPTTTPDGGVEMDADALVERCLDCLEGDLQRAGARGRQISAVGTCTYWHSILGVGHDNNAVSPVVLWADTRSVAEVEEWKQRVDVEAIRLRTGCPAHTSYVPAKLLWIARHRPKWASAAARWMSPGEYLCLRLFGRTGCGVSMASATGMYSHAENAWDSEVIPSLPIRADQLNPIVASNTPFQGILPDAAKRLPALKDVPWFPAAGDGACSNAGSGCFGPDQVALMVGTSGAVRVMREDTPELAPPPGLWKYRLDGKRYFIGGSLSNGGNVFRWSRDTLRVPDEPELEQRLAATEPDSHGLTVLPFLAGERSPGWHGEAHAALVGITWDTDPVEILQAGLEAVSYRFALLHELLGDAATPQHRLVASGGALLASPYWTQLLTDAVGWEMVECEESDASGRGAALLALEGAGIIPDMTSLPARLGRQFAPDLARTARYHEARSRQARLYDALLTRKWA